MKIFATILFIISISTVSGQNEDSLSFPLPDSLSISDTFSFEFSSFHEFVVPNCSQLYKKDGLWYWYDISRSNTLYWRAYCGTCVVKFDNDTTNTMGYEPYVPKASLYRPPACPTLENYSFGIRIVSNYIDGKRHGTRKYYDRMGGLIKTETYENGVLISTVYHKQ